jgi:hypothetical protein
MRGIADVHLVITLRDDKRNARSEKTIDVRVEALGTVREIESVLEDAVKGVKALDG